MHMQSEMEIRRSIFWLAALVAGWILTFVIEASLISGRGLISSTALRLLYSAIFFACPIILVINRVQPIFKRSVLSMRGGSPWVTVFVVLDVVIFQLAAIIGLAHEKEFMEIYLKHFLLLQAINLLFLWACVCAVVGQDRFHPFLKAFMRNPLGAIGYWLGYTAARTARNRRSAGKSRRRR